MVKITAPHNFGKIKRERCHFETACSARNIVQLKPMTEFALTLCELDLTETMT